MEFNLQKKAGYKVTAVYTILIIFLSSAYHFFFLIWILEDVFLLRTIVYVLFHAYFVVQIFCGTNSHRYKCFVKQIEN